MPYRLAIAHCLVLCLTTKCIIYDSFLKCKPFFKFFLFFYIPSFSSSIFLFSCIKYSHYERQVFRISYTLLVNKSHTLSSSYVPPYLTEARIPFHAPAHHEKTLMEKAAAKSAAKLFHRAAAENVTLMGISGYRSYRRQEALYRNALQRGSTAVAPPGTSEHQTGLALDISCASLNFELEESFAATKEGKWLKSNAPLYGFILRYPRRKEHITGYPWEPWHIRFVGKTLSLYLSLTGLTLEEYHDMLPDSSQIR